MMVAFQNFGLDLVVAVTLSRWIFHFFRNLNDREMVELFKLLGVFAEFEVVGTTLKIGGNGYLIRLEAVSLVLGN